MADIIKIDGARRVVANLRRQDNQFRAGVSRGLKKGGSLIQRESQLQVPVDTGALKASAFTRATGVGFQTRVTVGFTVPYALFVHEAVGMKLKGLPRLPNPPHKGRYWDPIPRAKAKFLEDPIRDNKDRVTQIVRDEAFKAKWKDIG